MNPAYKFASKEELDKLFEKTKTLTLDSIYRKIKTIWCKYIDAENFHISIGVADADLTLDMNIDMQRLGYVEGTRYQVCLKDKDGGVLRTIGWVAIGSGQL